MLTRFLRYYSSILLQCTVGHCVNMILLRSTTVILIMKTYICAYLYCSVYTISYIQSPLLLVKGVVLNKNRYFLNTVSTRKFWHLCIHTHHSGRQWGICVGIWLPGATRFEPLSMPSQCCWWYFKMGKLRRDCTSSEIIYFITTLAVP